MKVSDAYFIPEILVDEILNKRKDIYVVKEDLLKRKSGEITFDEFRLVQDIKPEGLNYSDMEKEIKLINKHLNKQIRLLSDLKKKLNWRFR